MTTSLEDELARTLAGAADHMPEPDEGFVVGVRRRQHVRRRRRLAAMAACVAVLVVVSGVAVTKLAPSSGDAAPVGGDTLPVRDTPWSGTIPDFAKAGTPDKVWPEAVHKLPAELPGGGGAYRVYKVLGGDRYLVQQLSKSGAPSVFDARTGVVTFLGTEAQAAKADPADQDWTTALGDSAVWFSQENPDQEVLAVWTARLDGSGDPRQIATVTDPGGFPGISVTGGSAYWYQNEGPGFIGLFEVPVPDGDGMEKVPGGETYASVHLSPWASTSRSDFTEDESREGTLWNLETGERRPWRAHPDAERIKCFPLLCLAWSSPDKAHLLQPLDGSRIVEVPYPWGDFDLSPAVDGGFGVGHVKTSRGDQRYVWDFATGKAATVALSGEIFTGFEYSILQWPGSAGEIYVLDLAAIG